MAHNNYRRVHVVSDMTLDSSMNAAAMAYAKKLADRGGNLEHSKPHERPGQGENLAMSCGRGQCRSHGAISYDYEIYYVYEIFIGFHKNDIS